MDSISARSICLFLVLILIPITGAVGAGPSSSDNDRHIGWSRAPQEVCEQLHLKISEIPPYPEDDRKLMNVRSWPKTKMFDGKEYVQEFSAWEVDVGRPNLRSLSEIDSGCDYNTYYVTYSKDGERSSGRGPSYWWRADSTLMERSYLTPASIRTWSYDRSGVLYQFQFTERDSSDGGGRSGTEWFAEDGSLIACTVGNQHYWRDIRKDWSELYRLLVDFYHWKGPY